MSSNNVKTHYFIQKVFSDNLQNVSLTSDLVLSEVQIFVFIISFFFVVRIHFIRKIIFFCEKRVCVKIKYDKANFLFDVIYH